VIRKYTDVDFPDVVALLVLCGVDPPETPGELGGICFVAERDDKIVGVIFALTGLSTKAYVDYLAIHPDFRKTTILYRLLFALEFELKSANIRKYVFHVERDNYVAFKLLYDRREQFGITKLSDLHYFSREIAQ
jgi:ribosomal protein S18 acetylase RimI-like enzyme